MDQMASAVGGLVSIDFADRENPVVTPVDFDFSKTGYTLCIIDSRADHADLTDEYAAIPGELGAISAYFGKEVLTEVDEQAFYAAIPALRKQCGDRAVLRAIHIYEENRRVPMQVESLRRGDFEAFLRLENESGSFLQWTGHPSYWDKTRIGIYREVIPKWVPGSGRWNKMLLQMQLKWKVDRLKNTGLTLHKGSNWASLDQAGVECLVENRRLINKITRFSVCADEVYKQTVLVSRGLKVNRGDLRLTIWEEEDHPEILTMKHWSEIQESERLFARKFDPNVDKDVINSVIRKVCEKND
jgi:hypothetical protein